MRPSRWNVVRRALSSLRVSIVIVLVQISVFGKISYVIWKIVISYNQSDSPNGMKKYLKERKWNKELFLV
jgi:hypothetical protein